MARLRERLLHHLRRDVINVKLIVQPVGSILQKGLVLAAYGLLHFGRQPLAKASLARKQVKPWGQISMNSATQPKKPQEIELKLTLPSSDRDALVKILTKTAPLARRKAVQHKLLNVYYDTPAKDLHKMRVALRIRQVDSISGPSWVQTLKTGGAGGSALSQRGEWEENLDNNQLCLQALEATPWSQIDPDGTLFKALSPCFVTRFERKSWLIRAKDHSVVEVALDIGQIESANRCAPLCELELELKAGEPSSLFDLAQTIAAGVAVLPAGLSKAERGYALAQGTLDSPQRALPPHLPEDQTRVKAAQQVLRETFFHFTKNLETLLLTDDAEVVHQARVGWRRFKSALRLFKPVLARERMPETDSMQRLLDALGQLRDLDVALSETLPLIAPAYASSDPGRQSNWNTFVNCLVEAAKRQRLTVREAVRDPVVGATLLSMTRYIEEMVSWSAVEPATKASRLESWTEDRLRKLKVKLEQSIDVAADKDSQHRARILAKRLRYGLESMQTVLPKRLAKRWRKEAAALQVSIGLSRDFQRPYQLAVEFGAEAGLVEFLRGYASGVGR